MKKSTGVLAAAMIVFTCSTALAKWETDYEKALERAKQENRYILLDFTGSDWCGWCIKLDKEVFSQKAFKDFAEANLVCVEVDFPHGKKLPKSLSEQNEKLKNEHGIRGFPTIIMLNPSGKKIAQTGYKAGGPESYVEHLGKFIEEDGGKLGAATSGGGAGAASAVGSGPRTWTSSSGAKVEAEFVKFDDGWVHLKKTDGTMLKVSVLNLSEEDKKLVTK